MKNKSIFVLLLCLKLFAGSPDWLINPKPYVSEIKISNDYIELTNGLISRKIKMAPDAATISFKNLVSGQEYIRSVRPEGELIIDGMRFPIGGQIGQPIHNYLKAEWLKDLTTDPAAFHFVDYKVGDIEARFPWKKREEWISTKTNWPPKGKSIALRFKADEKLIESIISGKSSDKNRELIYLDEFNTLDDEWKIYASPANERNSFINEGKPGEIMALAHNSVFAERKLTSDTKVIIAKIDPGTDNASAWGPGLTLVLDNKLVKFNMRPTDKRFAIYDGEEEKQVTGFKPGKVCWLKMFIKPTEVVCSYSYDNNNWTEVSTGKTGSARAKSVRVGKTSWSGDQSDHGSMGERGRCKVESFQLFGSVKKSSTQDDYSKLSYLKDMEVFVHYNIYDEIPLISKWITLKNNSTQDIQLNKFKNEILAVTEYESIVDVPNQWHSNNLYVESDYAFGGGMSSTSSLGNSVFWNTDPLYKTQINYGRTMPCLLECYPQYGPDVTISAGEKFETFRTFELARDTQERERSGLTQRKMYRILAPWTQENPILMHVKTNDDEAVKMAIDQCEVVGFEMVILTFGSGYNIEDDSPENKERLKKLADYAYSKNIALGTYSLLASRRIGNGQDVTMPEGMRPRFGNSPCLESEWGQDYFRKLFEMYEDTGFDILEHDGSYPGDPCTSKHHPGHKGLDDSQWKQFQKIKEYYHWCRANGIYLNVPDWYFLNGSSKTGMGYRETNWSLPRKQQEIIERQNIFDGTWTKTPSMGWMFVPLTQYHGGGAAATIEPLKEHLPHYNQRLANLFTAGVQACYRGPRLFDSPETKTVVKKWVNFYKEHRDILDSDIIHLQRPDGRQIDGIMHVNPDLDKKALAVFHNPLDHEVKKNITLPLYYTGLTKKVKVEFMNGKKMTKKLDRNYDIEVEITIEAYGTAWMIIR